MKLITKTKEYIKQGYNFIKSFMQKEHYEYIYDSIENKNYIGLVHKKYIIMPNIINILIFCSGLSLAINCNNIIIAFLLIIQLIKIPLFYNIDNSEKVKLFEVKKYLMEEDKK